jgi:N-acetylglucosaminyldiphosphoundecaprenol N-acetyl-beta-D-mannosaminyltransferase
LLQITDVPIYHKGPAAAVLDVLTLLSTPPASLCISATGAHGLVEAQKDASFKKVLQQFYCNLPDGMPLVWVGRAKGFSTMARCYGPDFFAAVISQTANMPGVTHFFCGGKPGVAVELQKQVAMRFNNHQVVGTFCPPFSPMKDSDWQALSTAIENTQASIVWIGLSTPKQEYFASELARRTRVHLIVTVGAAFDFYTGLQRQAPRWMQQNGLEWFFRLCTEPRRLWRRYLEIVPKFVFYGTADLLKNLLKRKTA